jgi:protocatechuate 3,4-dioxygenase, alpha subunit
MHYTPIPSQTVGPYFAIGLTTPRAVARIAGAEVQGERVRLACKVIDGQGQPIPDAMIEIWQANAAGKYNHPDDTQEKPLDPHFVGHGRLGTDDQGECVFETIRPGRVPGPNGTLQAPHLAVSIFARGLLKRLASRIYFEGDPANNEDPILKLVPQDRRGTLLARPVADETSAWRFEFHVSGENETVFFDV